eukprot:4534897-Prymnesium_polylepis.1
MASVSRCTVTGKGCGLRNTSVPDDFLRGGGSEKAPMSSTRELKTAVRYSASGCSVLLKLETANFRERDADLAFISAFPNEKEVRARALAAFEHEDLGAIEAAGAGEE